jgi:hypothetical protein
MTGFRSSRQYEDGPPAWTRPEAFAHTTWFKRFWAGELKPLLRPLGLEGDPNLKGDNRGLLLTTESEMHQRRGYVLGWVRDMLGLREAEGWRAGPPPYLARLVQDFYKENGQSVAWVMFEAGRDPIRLRHRGYQETLSPATRPDFQFEANGLRKYDTIPLLAGIRLSAEGLVMMPPRGLPKKDAHFTRLAVRRTLAVESSAIKLTGHWSSWCLASPDGDREAWSRGSAPASGQHLLTGGINPARLMTWMKLDIIHGWTYSYAVDLHPQSGEVFSIRYARVPLRMQIELDPWLDDWLLTALRAF